MEEINEWRSLYERLKGQEQQVRTSLSKCGHKIAELELSLQDLDKARFILQEVAQLTQQELQYHISDVVSLALESVFPDPYKFTVEFVQKRGKTEAELWFEDSGGNCIRPLDASGGGTAEVASFALRVALWSLSKPATRPVLCIDEPLKWLKGGDLPEKGAAMIKEIAERVGVQILMVSHIADQISSADNVVEVRKKKGISYVHD